MNGRQVKISKFLSLVLRHKPATIGITLDPAGWVNIETLLKAAAENEFRFSREELNAVVANNDKKRFALSEDGSLIRASQGHSVEVELGYDPAIPPEFLFHGTATRFAESIERQGLLKGQRQHVHLSRDESTAVTVGRRHGKPVVFLIRAGEMHRGGHPFFISANGVWLTDHVPAQFLEVHTIKTGD